MHKKIFELYVVLNKKLNYVTVSPLKSLRSANNIVSSELC